MIAALLALIAPSRQFGHQPGRELTVGGEAGGGGEISELDQSTLL